jgi:hypothetical protein
LVGRAGAWKISPKLNQIEIYFSVVQRKVPAPNDFASLDGLEDRLLRFQDH